MGCTKRKKWKTERMGTGKLQENDRRIKNTERK